MVLSRYHYGLLVNNLPFALAYLQALKAPGETPVDYTFLEVNHAFEAVTGLSRKNIRGKKISEVGEASEILSFNWKEFFARAKKNLESSAVGYPECSDGSCWRLIVSRVEGDYFAMMIEDITGEQEAKLKEERDYMFRVYDSMKQYVLIVNSDYRFEFVNKSAREGLGNLAGERCYQYIMNRDIPCKDCVMGKLYDKGEEEPVEFNLSVAGKYMEGTATSLVKGDGSKAVLKVLEDVTGRRKAEEKLRYISFHDSLTGLYNRVYFEEEKSRLDTPRQFPLSLILGDVNGLKLINDAYGYSAGDEVLMRAAKVLNIASRREDIVARWGGDEFVILLPQTTLEDTCLIKERIFNKCREVSQGGEFLSLALGSATKDDVNKDMRQVFKEAEDEMFKHKMKESRNVRNQVLDTLLKTLEEKSYENEEHAFRLKHYCLEIGRKIRLSQSELKRLQLLSSLHDIGKINIPSRILTKLGKLNREEWNIVKKHPEVGYRIACSTGEFAHVAQEILGHHERWDGSGYPSGLRGEEIPLLSRIIAIADAYDVMTRGRPYRDPLSSSAALQELKKCAGTQFDPQLVEVFAETVQIGEGA